MDVKLNKDKDRVKRPNKCVPSCLTFENYSAASKICPTVFYRNENICRKFKRNLFENMSIIYPRISANICRSDSAKFMYKSCLFVTSSFLA